MSVHAFEDGLVRIYLDRIAALGVKALEGQDVSTEISQVVEEALRHFSGVKSSTELGNLERFAGQLKLRAELASSTQPQYRAAFEQARQLAAADLASKKAPGESPVISETELAGLPANFRQALVVRNALRVMPLLGRWGNFEFWSGAIPTPRAGTSRPSRVPCRPG